MGERRCIGERGNGDVVKVMGGCGRKMALEIEVRGAGKDREGKGIRLRVRGIEVVGIVGMGCGWRKGGSCWRGWVKDERNEVRV